MAVGYGVVGAEPAALKRAAWSNAGLIVAGLILALFVAVLPTVITAALLGAVALGIVLLARPELAVYLLVVAVPYESLREIQFGGLNATITEFVAFCGGTAFLLQVGRGQVKVRQAEWLRPLLVFGLVMVVSITQATDLKLSIKELLKLGEMALTYLLVLGYVDTPAKLRRLLLVVVLSATSEAMIGVMQTVVHVGPVSFARGDVLRGSGTFAQPNPFAGYLNLTLPLLVAVLVMNAPLARRLVRPALLVIAVALLLSVSRGALLGSIAAVALILGVYLPRARPVMIAGGVIFVVLLGATIAGVPLPGIGDKIAVAFGLDNVDVVNPTPVTWPVAERLAHMLAGLNMFFGHPLLGVGIGNYPAAYPRYRVAQVWQADLGHAHNYYINVAAEAGVFGLAAFLYVLGSAFVIVARLYREATDPLARALALGTLGVLVTVAVHSFFDNIFVHAMEAQLALVMGIAAAACRVAAAHQPDAAGPRFAGISRQGGTTTHG